MSKFTRILIIGATLAAIHLAGMTAVGQAQANDEPVRQPPTERQVGESWRLQGTSEEPTVAGDARRPPTEAQVGESWRHPTGAPVRPTEPSGQPGWLVVSLGVLAAALVLSGVLAVLAARRAGRRVRAGVRRLNRRPTTAKSTTSWTDGRPSKVTQPTIDLEGEAMQHHRTPILATIAAIGTVAVLVGAAVLVRPVRATPSTGVTTTILAKSLFDKIHVKAHAHTADRWKAHLKTRGQSDVYVVDNKFAPGGTVGWHSHPGPSLILVVAGTVTNYEGDDPNCTPHAYTAGNGFIDPGGGHVHQLRNDTGAPAETIAVQLLPKGADRRIDVPVAPGNCPF